MQTQTVRIVPVWQCALVLVLAVIVLTGCVVGSASLCARYLPLVRNEATFALSE